MIKTIASFFFLLAGLVILGVVIQTIGIHDIAETFLQFSPWGIIPLFIFSVLIHITGTLKWQYVLRTMGIRIKMFDLFRVGLIGNAVSYITPVAYIGGEAFRGYVLKERYGIPWQKSLSSIGIEKIAEASAWAITIFAGIIFYLIQTGISSFSKIIAISVISCLFFIGWVVVIYIFSFKKKSLVNPLIIKPFKLGGSKGGKFLSEVENEFFTFFSFKKKKQLLVAFQLAVLRNVFLWLRNIFLIYYLVNSLEYAAGLMALASSYIAYSLPIPAAVGAQEAILSFVFSNIGLGAGGGAVFTFLLRGADMLMMAVGLFYLFKWGIGFFAFKIMKRLKVESLNGV